ncbi:hypothetical protein SAMN02745121_05160 [Nannocystis exedens]|uniref:Uncharacterized protein n=1 Tax=Nannocystis exedens TaxID=54 RepID=A0A1I2CI86_9BACT|nr:hypothetical protein [Nannocystis exedens]PCC68272.1 hypothetical protein NAEX_01282 [Nannocystis exedens]SFE68079.1 hypothetical protein SAMN02745121_05160 [Nannocystis exedens]
MAGPFRTIPERVYEYGYRNGRQMSHFLVDVTASGRDGLMHALAIAFRDLHGRVAHVAEAGEALVLFARPPRASGLDGRPWRLRQVDPPLGLAAAVALAWDWLARADDGPDEHDGPAERGWHVFNGQFGVVDGVWETFVAIEPTYIYIPK